MNISNSECSSGCESGWTMYLDQLSNSTDPSYYNYYVNNNNNYNVQEDCEDLSMVSDASSGPPTRYHMLYENNCGYSTSPNINISLHDQEKKLKKKSARKNKAQCLDDTASSAVSLYSEDNVAPTDSRNSIENDPGNFSQAFASQNYEGESVKKKQLSFFKYSTKGKSSGSFLGRKRL